MYKPLYGAISQDNPRWLTISPKADDRDPNKYLNILYEEFANIRKFANKILGVVEFANLRMHFHIMYSLTDRDWETASLD